MGASADADSALGTATPPGLNDPYQANYDYYNTGAAGSPLDPSPGTSYYAMSLPGALARYIGTRVRSDSAANYTADISQGVCVNLFLCPSDTRAAQGTTIADGNGFSGVITPGSYNFNEEALGFQDSEAPVGYHRLEANLNIIPRQAENMYLADGRGRTEMADQLKNFWHEGYNCTMADILAQSISSNTNEFDLIRHRGKINVSFFDGHVQTFTTNSVDLQDVGVTLGFHGW